MARLTLSLAVLAASFVGSASAQASAWGQCGGQGWSGATTCVAGWTCVYSNAWYSQCLQSTGTPATSTTTTKSTTSTTSTTSKTSTTTGIITTRSTTSTSSPTTTTATATYATGSPIATLVGDWLWIRAVAAPNFHKYMRSVNSYAPGDAILGDYTMAAQFKIVGGQLEHYLPNGSLLYLNVETQSSSSVTKLKTYFTTTPNTYGAFAFSGDALTWTVASITRQNNAAWLACEGNVLYINLGAYLYNTPAGCADQTIHYYNGATAVNK